MVYLPNNRPCRGLKIVQNALECTMKWFYIVSQTFFMNSTMENPPWITVHLRFLLRNKLCTWHENKLPETFSVGQLLREIWNRCIGMYISCLKMLHLPLIYRKMSPLRVTKGVCEAIPTHTNPWGRLKWPYNQTTDHDRPLYVISLLGLTCLTETMQTSLNITKPQILNPNRTSKHCEVLNY